MLGRLFACDSPGRDPPLSAPRLSGAPLSPEAELPLGVLNPPLYLLPLLMLDGRTRYSGVLRPAKSSTVIGLA